VRVLFIATAFPRHEGDVITPWMTETLVRLRARGVDAQVLAPAYRGLGDHEIRGIPVHRFRYAPRRWETLSHDQTVPDRLADHPAFLALVPGYILSGMRAAARLARAERFDLIHVHWPIPHALMGFAARWAQGTPVICTWHGAELRWVQNRWPILSTVVRSIVTRGDAHTVNSTHTEAQLKAVRDCPVFILPFGSTVTPRANADTPPSGTLTPFEFLFVGRLVERKGVHVLLDAVARLPEDLPIHLRIVGDGPLRPALEQRVQELGLEGRVTFSGFVSESELVDAYAQCSAFVLPAVFDAKGDTEGLGVVLIEALAFGKPAVASGIGGIPDVVVDGETGILVPPNDPDALARALETLVGDPAWARRLGEAGKQRAETRFSWNAILDRTVQMYASVLAQKAR
jgi:glycosyltransferase involved in cell wall biosynthesis